MQEHSFLRKSDLLRVPFFLSTCLLFVTTGLDRMVYPFLYLSGLLGCGLLSCAATRVSWKVFFSAVWFPLPFLLYTAITPGLLFKDLPVADTMFSAYVVGLTSVCFFAGTYWRFFLCLALTLAGSSVLFFVLGFPQYMIPENRLVLFLHHPNVMASVASWCILFFVTRLNSFTRKEQVWLWVLLTPCALALALSVGRSAYIGFLVAMLFLACTIWKKYLLRIFLGLMVFCALTYAFLPASQQQRMLSAIANPLQDDTFKSRLPIWLVVCEGIRQSPWMGNSVRGFFDFHKRYVATNKEELQRNHPLVEPLIGHPHSTYMGIVYVNGIAGTVLFFLALLPAVRRAWREQDMFFLSVMVFSLGYGLLEYFLHRKEGILFVFFPLGVVYGRSLLAALQSESPGSDKDTCGGQAE